MHFYLTVSAVLNGVISLFAGIFILFKKPRNTAKKLFAFFCLLTAFWSLGNFLTLIDQNGLFTTSSFWLTHIGVLFLSVINFHFICVVLEIEKKKKKIIWSGYLLNTLILAFALSQFFSKNTDWNNPGILYHVWITLWITYVIFSEFLLIKFRQKKQTMLMAFSNFIFFSALLLNLSPTYEINLLPFFNIAIAIAIVMLFSSLSNARLNFFGITKKITSLTLALIIGFSVSYLAFLKQEDPFVLLVFPVLAIITYFSVSSFFDSRFFYRILRLEHINDFKENINILFRQKNFYTNFQELDSTINEIFTEKLNISFTKIILLTSENKEHYDHFLKYFEKDTKGYLVLKNENREIGELCFPILKHTKKIIGFFILGNKPRHSIYSNEEIEIIKSAVFHIGLSLRALQYNFDLKTEVAEKTAKLNRQKEELEKSYEKLKKLDEAKDSFLSIASHELRTPLTIIKGYCDFLLSEEFGMLNEKQKNFQEKIYKSTNDLLALVGDILDISKLEAGQMMFHYSIVNIKNLINEVIADFKIMCPEKNITLVFANPENLEPCLNTDPKKLKQILTNLLGNAFKFTSRSGEITVRIRNYPANSHFLQIEVQDTGIGIAEDAQKTIFDKFSQVENYLQKSYNGTGLGLSIVKKIVEKTGGKVWVESELKKGSSFFFLIPQKDE